ncbi:hypothetical protein BpHYR1_016510 [Brachionus plicatilis]|uniref:Uncharacterized protein n=1 Tax=Brachionus plicatilis TaxID=10195 RepID=A0A3M7R7B4_BRAPC|nr:hypothetical protein BpHYR1_016510 [Brachionus plicatilis]
MTFFLEFNKTKNSDFSLTPEFLDLRDRFAEIKNLLNYFFLSIENYKIKYSIFVYVPLLCIQDLIFLISSHSENFKELPKWNREKEFFFAVNFGEKRNVITTIYKRSVSEHIYFVFNDIILGGSIFWVKSLFELSTCLIDALICSARSNALDKNQPHFYRAPKLLSYFRLNLHLMPLQAYIQIKTNDEIEYAYSNRYSNNNLSNFLFIQFSICVQKANSISSLIKANLYAFCPSTLLQLLGKERKGKVEEEESGTLKNDICLFPNFKLSGEAFSEFKSILSVSAREIRRLIRLVQVPAALRQLGIVKLPYNKK